MTEAGFGEDTFVQTSFGVAAPAGTPRAIVDQLNGEIRKTLAQRDVIERLSGAGLDAAGGSPEEMTATVRLDVARFGALVKAIGIEPE